MEQWRLPEAAIEEAVRLFNAGEFFEVHEVLEVAWRPAEGDLKQLLKGLIHAAVALYQYGRKNLVAARSKYRSSKGYLAPFLPAAAGVDLAALQREMDEFFESILIETDPRWRPASDPRPRLRRVDSARAGVHP